MKGADELRRLSDKPAEFKKFYKTQLVIAGGVINSLRRFTGASGYNTTSAELPDATEAFNEAYSRVCEGQRGYVWDGSGSFPSFFARCIRAACNSLRDGERRHRRGQQAVVAHKPMIFPEEQDDLVANGQYEKALGTAIATTSMTGKGATYAERLGAYALEKWSVQEIAKDLDVTVSTVPPYRARLLKNKNFLRALKRSLDK